VEDEYPDIEEHRVQLQYERALIKELQQESEKHVNKIIDLC